MTRALYKSARVLKVLYARSQQCALCGAVPRFMRAQSLNFPVHVQQRCVFWVTVPRRDVQQVAQSAFPRPAPVIDDQHLCSAQSCFFQSRFEFLQFFGVIDLAGFPVSLRRAALAVPTHLPRHVPESFEHRFCPVFRGCGPQAQIGVLVAFTQQLCCSWANLDVDFPSSQMVPGVEGLIAIEDDDWTLECGLYVPDWQCLGHATQLSCS